MNLSCKEVISFTEKEEITISDMIDLLNNIKENCQSEEMRYSVFELRNAIEEFLQCYNVEK